VGEPIVIVGAGGMGRCVADVVDAVNASAGEQVWSVVGVLDDGEPETARWADRDLRLLGGVDLLDDLPRDVGVVLGVASTAVRRRIDERVRVGGRRSPVLVHPNVHRGFGVRLGPGTVVCSHVSIESDVRSGRHVHLNQNSTIGHDTVVEDYVTVSPLTAVSGATRLGEGAFLGTGSSVNQGLTVGSGAVVGAGAAVVHDVPPGRTVVGVPARVLEPRAAV
jgi:hypothetical protein